MQGAKEKASAYAEDAEHVGSKHLVINRILLAAMGASKPPLCKLEPASSPHAPFILFFFWLLAYNRCTRRRSAAPRQ